MKTIMVIEDDKSMLDAVGMILKMENYKVLMAENGVKAMELLNQNKKPDLILLDMVMPEMNGWEFADAYAKNFTDLAPILVLTGAAEPSRRAADIQAAGYLEKPYEIEVLLSAVQKIIGQ
jgi:CheY-like chemotaxis protein